MRCTIDNKFQALDQAQAAQYVIGQPDGFLRANSFMNPLGPSPGQAFLLMLRQDLLKLDLDALHRLDFEDDLKGRITIEGLVIHQSRNLTPGGPEDPLSLYLVQMADCRWRCHNPKFAVSINKQFNVRSPAYTPSATAADHYYADSLNGGALWTWTTMASSIWSILVGQLGAYPGLPFTPDGNPEDWKFVGVSAWIALSQVLARIGCAVAVAVDGSTSIVRVGVADPAADKLIARYGRNPGKKLLDTGEFIEGVRGELPYGVRVFFHRLTEHYGTEQTTPRTVAQWASTPAYSVDIVGPEALGAEPATYHPIWDDLPALQDITGAVTNAAALATRAQERADDYYRMLRTGGSLLRNLYSGALPFTPGSTIKGVAWRFGQGGLTTEVVRHPSPLLAVDDTGLWGLCCFEDSSKLHAPDLRPTLPVYPHLLQVVRIVSATKDVDGLMDAFVQQRNPAGSWADKEACWALDVNGSADQANRYLARLDGYQTGRPVYAIRDMVLDATLDVVTNVCPEIDTPDQNILTHGFPFLITTANGTWVTVTNISIYLPEAALYKIQWEARTHFQVATLPPGLIATRLWDVTAGAAVPNSERLGLLLGVVGVLTGGTNTGSVVFQAATARTIQLQAKRDGFGGSAPTWTTSTIFAGGDGHGETAMCFHRLDLGAKVETRSIALPGTFTLGAAVCTLDPEDCCPTTACSVCNPAPAIWELGIGDVTDFALGNCVSMRGEFLLAYDATGFVNSQDANASATCAWYATIADGPGNAVTYIWLAYYPAAGGSWEIHVFIPAFGTIHSWLTIPANFNCLGANILGFVSDAGKCATWPANVTVKPYLT